MVYTPFFQPFPPYICRLGDRLSYGTRASIDTGESCRRHTHVSFFSQVKGRVLFQRAYSDTGYNSPGTIVP
jgi:hypothetical protein